MRVTDAIPGQGALTADTVVVVGKGHEKGQEAGGVVHPFDDRLVLRDALEHRHGRRTKASP